VTSRILLVRHGRSAIQHDGRWMPITGVKTYEDAYNAAGILDDDAPPTALTEAAARADVLATSHYVRALASVRRLASAREPDVSPLLCEIAIDPPALPVRLPIEVWDAISFVQWTCRLCLRADREEVRHPPPAVDWLEQHATGGRTVCAVTHGGFRRILDVELLRRGWSATPGARTHENWSSWTYVHQ
jgi:broad specificity phosphatase PhoE